MANLTGIIGIVTIACMLVVSCAPAPKEEGLPTAGPPPLQGAQETKDAAQAPPIIMSNPELTALFEKADKIKSYSFDLAQLPGKDTGPHYLIKGDKGKVILLEEILVDDGAVDVVYLDFSTKTAVGYCVRERTRCPDLKQGRPMPFERFDVVRPETWMDTLRDGVLTKTASFYKFQVRVVRTQHQNQYFEGYVHATNGMPMRIVIATDPEMTQVVGGYEYRSMAFDNVQDTDVTPP